MPIRITVRKLMAGVAVLGMILAACRTHFSLGSFVAGAVGIAWIETAREVRRREATHAAVGAVATIGRFARAVAMAAVIIAGSAIPVLLIGPLLWPTGGCRPGASPQVLMTILPLALVASSCVARWLRRLIGRDETCDERMGCD